MAAVLLGALAYGLLAWLASGDDVSKVAQEDTPAAAPAGTRVGPAGRSVELKQVSAAESDERKSALEERSLSADAESEVEAVVAGSEATEPQVQAPSESSEVDDQVADADAAPDAEQPTAEPEAFASPPDSADTEIPRPGGGDSTLAPHAEPVPPAEDRSTVAEHLNPAPSSTDDVESVSVGTGALSSGTEAVDQVRPQEPAIEGQTAAPSPKAAFEGGVVAILAPSVQRFSLASAIESREPVSGLEALRFDAHGLAAVYAFSEVEGLSGSTLQYHWSHKGEEVAVVAVHVRADRWRSHSSKYIDETMSGAWSVQLRDADGNRLAEADFTVHSRIPLGGQ